MAALHGVFAKEMVGGDTTIKRQAYFNALKPLQE